ncbi:ATP-binding protein [Desulfoscipio geothermicus]|uniref:MinD superfamily P-loop ATPase, contains an inserted ferredoxin domain n=1 Tax=Desulfoscipio geothermicus DSM 3669 TaxID=1121426 RepID=A0A1I6CYW5_9FIRM|nr:ATP-binding protein [Desulfoscipio geothermicus]SFQ98419.1 MinD superfamily P-loop ATPase, contains an inserted ferredoxin domain [Desulfoscipio geothermicus DSM 3669]
MKEITVISGKGGTGKTSVTASFAVLAENHVITDCDVDAANLHLLLAPEIMEVKKYWGMPRVEINAAKCTGCGLCETLCRYDAVSGGAVDKLLCEGCLVCYHACPAGAMRPVENLAGEWYLSRTRYGPFVHARLGVAQDNSGKLVARVRQRARDLAEKTGRNLIITDGPPGIGCPVISALGGTDLALVVTEPTLSAMHDLVRVLDLAAHFGVRAAVCINKWDINPDNCRAVEDTCRDMNVPVLGRIPYDPAFMAAALEKKPVIKMTSTVVNDIISLWDCVKKELGL